MSKDQISKKLTELNIPHDPSATKADLEKLLPEGSTEDEKGSVTVKWQGQSRVYTKELHGAEFKALAKEFAAKKGGTVV